MNIKSSTPIHYTQDDNVHSGAELLQRGSDNNKNNKNYRQV